MSHHEWEQLKSRSPVRIQWDPERDLLLRPLEHRAVQIGLSKEAVQLYVSKWIQRITDITPQAHAIQLLLESTNLAEAALLLPPEQPYPPIPY